MVWPPPNSSPATYSNEQLSVLLEIVQVQGEPFHSAASKAVWQIAPELLTNSPARYW